MPESVSTSQLQRLDLNDGISGVLPRLDTGVPFIAQLDVEATMNDVANEAQMATAGLQVLANPGTEGVSHGGHGGHGGGRTYFPPRPPRPLREASFSADAIRHLPAARARWRPRILRRNRVLSGSCPRSASRPPYGGRTIHPTTS
jgi:hypothetical protein